MIIKNGYQPNSFIFNDFQVRSICHNSLGSLRSNRMYFLFFLGLVREDDCSIRFCIKSCIWSYVQFLSCTGSKEYPVSCVDSNGISFLTELPFVLSFYRFYGLYVVFQIYFLVHPILSFFLYLFQYLQKLIRDIHICLQILVTFHPSSLRLIHHLLIFSRSRLYCI